MTGVMTTTKRVMRKTRVKGRVKVRQQRRVASWRRSRRSSSSSSGHCEENRPITVSLSASVSINFFFCRFLVISVDFRLFLSVAL